MISETLNLALAGYIGLAFGGFATVCIPRLATNEERGFRNTLRRLSFPSSSCSCGRELGPLELTPGIGYLISRGSCVACKQQIPVIYPATEVATATLFLVCLFEARNAELVSYITSHLIPLTLIIVASILPRRMTLGTVAFALTGATLSCVQNDPSGSDFLALLFAALAAGALLVKQSSYSRIILITVAIASLGAGPGYLAIGLLLAIGSWYLLENPALYGTPKLVPQG